MKHLTLIIYFVRIYDVLLWETMFAAYAKRKVFNVSGKQPGKKEKENEKNLSTQEKTKKQSARFQSKNEDHRRTQNAC